MLKKFKLQCCFSLLAVCCLSVVPYSYMNIGGDISVAQDENELVATFLQPGELSAIEEGGSLVYLSSKAISALTDVSAHAKEKEETLQEVQDILARVDSGYHTAGNAETLLAIKAASLYAMEQNVSGVSEILTEYETALEQGDASFVSKRSCPPLLKKECLEVANLCVKNSCILGNEKICGSLKVGGNINLTNDCPCCACKSNVIGTVSGAFHPDTQVIDARINLSVDFDFTVDTPFAPVPDQGCIPPFDNPFKGARACIVSGNSDVEVLEASISSIKGIVLERFDRTQFATEFTIVVGYPCFTKSPVVALGYNNQGQGALLYSLTNFPFHPVTLYNIFLNVANVQHSYVVVKAIFYFEAVEPDLFGIDALPSYQQLLLQIQDVINSSSLSLRIFGT